MQSINITLDCTMLPGSPAARLRTVNALNHGCPAPFASSNPNGLAEFVCLVFFFRVHFFRQLACIAIQMAVHTNCLPGTTHTQSAITLLSTHYKSVRLGHLLDCAVLTIELHFCRFFSVSVCAAHINSVDGTMHRTEKKTHSPRRRKIALERCEKPLIEKS